MFEKRELTYEERRKREKQKKQVAVAVGGAGAIGGVIGIAILVKQAKKPVTPGTAAGEHLSDVTTHAEHTETIAEGAQISVEEGLDAVIKRDWTQVTSSLISAGTEIFNLRISNVDTLISAEKAKKAHAKSDYNSKKKRYDANLKSMSAITFLSGEMEKSKKAMKAAKSNYSKVSGRTSKAIKKYEKKKKDLIVKRREFTSSSGKYFSAAEKNFVKQRKAGKNTDESYSQIRSELEIAIKGA